MPSLTRPTGTCCWVRKGGKGRREGMKEGGERGSRDGGREKGRKREEGEGKEE